MTKESILEVPGGLQPEVRERFQAELKGFFGSYAHGEQSRGSDAGCSESPGNGGF